MTTHFVDKWNDKVQQFQASKTRTKDMTKLFFVHHQKISEIIKDPIRSKDKKKIKEAEAEILKILEGIGNYSDPFVQALISQNNIKEFKGSFQDLIQMLKSTLRLNKQKSVVNCLIKKRAFSATDFKKDKYRSNLNQQIRSSNRRMSSVRAGQSLETAIRQPLPRSKTACQYVNPQKQFREKRLQVQSMMRSFIIRKSSDDFKIMGKTQRIGQYFKKRKQLVDLYVGSKYQSFAPQNFQFQQSQIKQQQNSQPHFITQLGIDLSKIKKPSVKQNIQKIVNIVNSKLIDDREKRQMIKYQKIKQIQFNKMADVQIETLEQLKRKREQKLQRKKRQLVRQYDKQSESKFAMMSTFRSTTAFNRRIYLQNTPSNRQLLDIQRMSKKFSSRKY